MRFISFEIFSTGVLRFECATSVLSSLFVQLRRTAARFFAIGCPWKEEEEEFDSSEQHARYQVGVRIGHTYEFITQLKEAAEGPLRFAPRAGPLSVLCDPRTSILVTKRLTIRTTTNRDSPRLRPEW